MGSETVTRVGGLSAKPAMMRGWTRSETGSGFRFAHAESGSRSFNPWRLQSKLGASGASIANASGCLLSQLFHEDVWRPWSWAIAMLKKTEQCCGEGYGSIRNVLQKSRRSNENTFLGIARIQSFYDRGKTLSNAGLRRGKISWDDKCTNGSRIRDVRPYLFTHEG